MNEERKHDFIIESAGSEQKGVWIAALFRGVSLLEEEYGKDLAEMTPEEVSKSLAVSDVTSSITIANRLSLVIRYKQWCKDKGFDSVLFGTKDISVDMTENVRATMVYSPKELQRIIESAFKIEYDLTPKYIYRAYLWLGFAGLFSSDAVNVRVSDVDFRQRCIYSNNRMYRMPDEAVKDLKAICKMTEFVIPNKNGAIKTYKRSDGDTILRGRKNKAEVTPDRYVRSTLNTALTTGLNAAGYTGLSYVRVRKSGLFYEMLRREVVGIPANFYEIAHDDYIHGGKHETPKQSKQKILRRTMLTYERDYASWKKAFETELKSEFGVADLPDTLSK